MSIELDHVFICCSADAAADLTAFGLTEGAGNVHPGQGTACRRFFFHNAFLELLWVSDPSEAQSKTTRPTYLWERWTGRDEGTCPFGMGFRPGPGDNNEPPFATWQYRPAYLPESLNIQVGMNCELLTEPWLFFLPFARRRPDDPTSGRRQPLQHAAGFREISHVELVIPRAHSGSPELRSLVDHHLVSVSEGAKPLMTLGFDGKAQGKYADFRPALPLRFNW
jgi:hypothetical protein